MPVFFFLARPKNTNICHAPVFRSAGFAVSDPFLTQPKTKHICRSVPKLHTLAKITMIKNPYAFNNACINDIFSSLCGPKRMHSLIKTQKPKSQSNTKKLASICNEHKTCKDWTVLGVTLARRHSTMSIPTRLLSMAIKLAIAPEPQSSVVP